MWMIRERLLVSQPVRRSEGTSVFSLLGIVLPIGHYALEAPWHEMEPSPPGEDFPHAASGALALLPSPFMPDIACLVPHTPKPVLDSAFYLRSSFQNLYNFISLHRR